MAIQMTMVMMMGAGGVAIVFAGNAPRGERHSVTPWTSRPPFHSLTASSTEMP